MTLGAGHVAADPVLDAAEQAIVAARANDTLRLRMLARADRPDPWLVAEELILRGEEAAATALAAHADLPDVKALATYVAQREPPTSKGSGRPCFLEAVRALEDGRHEDALARLQGTGGSNDDVASAVVLYARGVAQLRLKQCAIASFADAAATAERIGWLRMASRGYRAAVHHALTHGRLDAARHGARQLLALGKRRAHPGTSAHAHEQLAIVARRAGDATGATACLEEALHAHKRASDNAGRARCLARLGDLNLAAGRLEVAERSFVESVALAKRAKQTGIEARGRRGAAIVLARLGSLDKAEMELRSALELAKAAGLDDLRGEVLADLGTVLLQQGQYSRALACADEGVEVLRTLGSREELATVLMNVGVTHASLGKHEVALRHLEEARTLSASLGDSPRQARILSNIGVIHAALGDLDEALACQQRASGIAAKTGDASSRALVFTRIGHVQGQRGDYAEAIAMHERALAIKRTLKDRLGEAISLESLGTLHQQLGHFADAEARQREALYVAERIAARDVAARAHWGLAELALLSADPERALASARKSVEALPALARGLFDEQGAHARERWAGVYDVGMCAAATLDDVDAFTWFLERQRSATLLESLGAREALERATVPPALFTALSNAREVEARRLRAHRDAQETGRRRQSRKTRRALQSARQALVEARERITLRMAAKAPFLSAEPASAAELRRLMRPGDALVLYALLPDHAYAVVVTTRGLTLHSLGPARTLVEACSGLDDQCRGQLSEACIGRFRKLLIEPLELGKRVKRLIVSPDGALCAVPFALLVPEVDVSHVSSGTTYGWLRKANRSTRRGRGVLALGRPVYGPMEVAQDPGPDGAQRGPVRKAHPAGLLPPLEGSAIEARSVGDMVLTDEDATEDALQAALLARERWRALHLACHGLVDFDRPLFSSLALTPNAYGDGLLTTLDVFSMRVPADLVVLSACETGRGRLMRTEGVFGFTRAFMVAGAPRVIVSLWKVDDEATRALMQRFYAHWNPGNGERRGLAAARALRLAQADVRADPRWADPYYWAAWQLWGLPD
ncbi:MAG: CHAT domain-containing protein [Planctomycetota bacterium]|nr:CHAT domain-containing protein [Planctomycetota bacterium]